MSKVGVYLEGTTLHIDVVSQKMTSYVYVNVTSFYHGTVVMLFIVFNVEIGR